MAALFGLAVGDLTASFTNPASSPLLVVGTALINAAPTPAKTFAIKWFGTADKPLLVGAVLLGTLAIAALAGALSRRRPELAMGLIIAIAFVVGMVASAQPTFGQFGFVPAIVTGVVTATGLLVFRQFAIPKPTPAESAGTSDSRRVLLTSAGLLTAAGLTAGIARHTRRGADVVRPVALPKPERSLKPLPRGLGTPGVTPLRTADGEFYRVDTRLRVPAINPEDWSLTIDGDVGRRVRFTYKQLLKMPLIERDITLVCVSNPVGGPYAGGARWLGVRLTDLLDKAGPGSGHADQILSTDVGGMTISTPLAAATDGRDSMIAVGMNGQPLPQDHGFPARLIVPGLYGFIGATKWITRMTLTTYDKHDAYWTERGWATKAPIKIASRIDTPSDGEELDRGEIIVGGIAWAHTDGGVAGVQVRVDDGKWRDATLGPSGGADYWRQWFIRWPAKRGKHTVAARALGTDGTVQPAKLAEPFPDGASGFDAITVSVV